MNNKDLSDLFFELGMLKRQKTTGPLLAGVENPESLADGIARSMYVGLVLAYLEKADPYKVLLMLLSRSMPATRLPAKHKVASTYVKTPGIKETVLSDQISVFPEDLKKEIEQSFKDWDKRQTKEAIVTEDAHELELAISAKELLEKGYSGMQVWIDRIEEFLRTDSAKQILKEIKKNNSNNWWQDLKVPVSEYLKKYENC